MNPNQSNPILGFESYNTFKKSVRDIRQLYDITNHLYTQESVRLGEARQTVNNKTFTLMTSTGIISHGINALYQRLQNSYPFKLKQLLLISAITSLEVYLTDVIYEVFKRNQSAFMEETSVTMPKNHILSFDSIDALKNKLIEKDVRGLTSGGLKEIEKYYKRVLKVDFRTLNVSLTDIQEIHTRRHLFVHRDGVADSEFCRKFPSSGYKEGDKILLDSLYFTNSLEKLVEFASNVNKQLLNKFPEKSNYIAYDTGAVDFDFDNNINIMVELLLKSDTFANIAYIKSISGVGNAIGKTIEDHLVQITVTGKQCFVFLSGSSYIINGFMRPLRQDTHFKVSQTIKIK